MQSILYKNRISTFFVKKLVFHGNKLIIYNKFLVNFPIILYKISGKIIPNI